MARNIAISVNWNDRQGRIDYPAIIERVKIADAAGVHSVWIPEGWGRDVFTLLALSAYETDRIRLGTGIVNVYSRTPAALAQHFATLDELSEGRMLIGLGTSGAQVIEHFHGVPFEPPRTRLREYIEIMQTLLKGEKLHYEGMLFDLRRGFTLRFQPVRDRIPIHLATLNAKALKLTAELADGWLPIWLPMKKLKAEIASVRAMSVAAGRPADAVSVRAPGDVAVTSDVAKVRAAHAATAAFYIGRMGVYYAAQLSRLGHAETVEKVKAAWKDGSRAAAQAVTDELVDETLCAGSAEECLDRLEAQTECGVDIHTVDVEAADPRAYERTLKTLVG